MIQELLTYFLPVAKFILAAALMVVFYNLLYKEKTTFNRCRIYLLSIAFVSLLLSQFNIVVYTPPARIVEVPTSISGIPFTSGTMPEQPMNVVSSNAVEEPTFMERIGAFLTIKNILITIYLLVTIGLLVSLFIQLFQILATKRKGKVTLHNGYEMVVSPGIPTPFSFFKSIYIGENLSGSKLELILKHEQWHIKHQHYLDVLVMEIIVRIFWFNPVLWWVRKELRNVSEFQADRSVLDEGHDLYKYQTIIMEEVMEYNPYLANGFNNSFTKKRFIMMKNKCQTSFTTLRRALLVPFLAVVFSVLSLSVGKSQVKYVTKTTTSNRTITKTVEVDSLNSPGTITTIDTSFSVDNASITTNNNLKIDLNAGTYEKAEIDKALKDCSVGLGSAITELKKLSKTSDVAVRKAGINKLFKGLDVKASNTNIGDYEFREEFIKSFTSEDFLKSAVNFSKIKEKVDGLQKEPSTNTKLVGFQTQVLSLMQDQVFTKVLTEVMSGAMGTLMGAMGNMAGADGNIKNMTEAKDMVTGMLGAMTGSLGAMTGSLGTVSDKSVSSDESAEINVSNVDPYAEAMKNGYRLKPEQIKVLDMPYSGISIYSIEKSKLETRITLATPMIAEDYWVRFSRDFRIIDPKTKDTYMIRRLENNIPLSEFIFAPGIRSKMIAITLIFPPLKESVKRIDLLEVVEPDAYMPSNSGNAYQFTNVIIDDYLVPGSRVPKIYR